jgi:DNA-binding response OmpR family regulator
MNTSLIDHPPPVRIVNTHDVYDDGFLRIEHRYFFVSCGGKSLSMGRTEFLILSILAQFAGRYLSREDIWDHIWDDSRPLNSESLKVLVYNVRRRLAPFDITIETGVGIGYRLVPRSEE